MNTVVKIVPDGRREFGLVAGFLQHFRVDVGDASERAIEGACRNPATDGRAAEGLYPLAEPGVGERVVGSEYDCQGQAGGKGVSKTASGFANGHRCLLISP